jgi:phosphate transport system protein
MNDVTKGHTVHAYDQELGRVRGLVLEMGEYVLEQTRMAVNALAEGDPGLARQVVDREPRVDHFELDADEAIFSLIAKRQPAALDLRLILALSKVVGDLERAGDKAEQIAWCVIRLLERDGQQPASRILHHVRRLDEVARSMLERSLEALNQLDVEGALDVFADDHRLDEEFEAGLRHLMTFVLEDSSLVGQLVDLVFALRALERIGQHAGNIAEQVIFIAKGKDVRYQNKEVLIETLRRRGRR